MARSVPCPKGDKCCTLSHELAWRTFLDGGESHGLFLEDDVDISPDAGPLLRDANWIPPDVGLLKLERFGPAGQRILISDRKPVAGGREIGRLRSKHTGGAALYPLACDGGKAL